ncbi:MAG: polysaccharide export protein [Alphaproteobacteria bacterium]|nr:polysaccharide biosynthesis/export family protein [Alphaproteobacteria bacterium]TAD89559.1 MAG: polysaccharide export protein [Alphaproteobacteria bacterium]
MTFIWFRRIALALALGTAQACSSMGVVAPEADQPLAFAPWTADVPGYRLKPGDEIEVRLLYNPEFSDRVLIGPDGRFALSLIGSVRAEGMTADELGVHLRERFSRDLRRPDVVVVPRLYGSQRVIVGGEVASPGVHALPGRVGVLEAVLIAGGFTANARPQSVALIRRGADGRPMLRSLDLQQFLSTGDPSQDVPLLPFDIVYVPRSTIAEINRFVTQYIRGILPFDSGFSYTLSRDLTRGATGTGSTSPAPAAP